MLIDPPFEAEGEFDRIVNGLAGAYRKWKTGIFMIWYPVKDARAVETFVHNLAALGVDRILRAELFVAKPAADAPLAAAA